MFKLVVSKLLKVSSVAAVFGLAFVAFHAYAGYDEECLEEYLPMCDEYQWSDPFMYEYCLDTVYLVCWDY